MAGGIELAVGELGASLDDVLFVIADAVEEEACAVDVGAAMVEDVRATRAAIIAGKTEYDRGNMADNRKWLLEHHKTTSQTKDGAWALSK